MNTSIPQKKKYFPEFVKKMEKGIMCGGKRYALTDDKEITDLVCELAGNEWIIGNIVKYAGEYINEGYEQDLIKIANYAFILYLKDYEKLNKGKDEGEQC